MVLVNPKPIILVNKIIIIDHKYNKKTHWREYPVKQAGDSPTWESEAQLMQDIPEVIRWYNSSSVSEDSKAEIHCVCISHCLPSSPIKKQK